MATVQPRDKYFLRSLHEEIGLFDRKLAHMLKYDSFATDKERDAATHKLSTKREQLVRTARQLMEEGTEYKASDLPRSLRSGDQEAPAEMPITAAEAQVEPFTAASEAPARAAYEGTVLDFRQEMKEYIEKRKKAYIGAN